MQTQVYQPPYATGYAISGERRPAPVSLRHVPCYDPPPDPRPKWQGPPVTDPRPVVLTPWRPQPAPPVPAAAPPALSEVVYALGMSAQARREHAAYVRQYGQPSGYGSGTTAPAAYTDAADRHHAVAALLGRLPVTAATVGAALFAGNSGLASGALLTLWRAGRARRIRVLDGVGNGVWGYVGVQG
jgi:hypothetical protein